MALTPYKIKITADASALQREMGKAANIAQTNADKIEKSFKGVGAALAGLGVGLYINKIVTATVEQERVTKQLEATLKSTGGAAGLTRDELLNMASGLQKVTTFGDEATIAAQSLLLTFTGIGRDVFPQALESVLNVSTAMGTDLKSAALQVGKALNDPIKGMASLSESGIQFSAAQRETIKSFVETGQQAKAQAVILKELETQFGGSARAARDTMGGALKALQNAFGDLLEGDTGGDGVRGATQSIDDLAKLMESPEVKNAFGSITQAVFKLLDLTSRAAVSFADFGKAIGEGLARSMVGSDNPIERVNEEIATLEERLKLLAGELSTTRLMRVNPFQSTEDMQRDYDAVLTRLRTLRDVRASIGSISPGAPAAVAPTSPAGLPNGGGGGGGGGKPKAPTKVNLNLGEDTAAGKAYASAMEAIAKAQLSAEKSGLQMNSAQSVLYDLMRAPEWSRMPEVWQQLVIEQTAAATAADELAQKNEALQKQRDRLNELVGAPGATINAQREDMLLLADAFERSKISVEQYTEAVMARLGTDVPQAAKDASDAMSEFSKNFAASAQGTIADLLFTGADEGFDGLVKNFGRALQRMAAEAAAAKIMESIFGESFGKTGKVSAGSLLGLAASVISMGSGVSAQQSPAPVFERSFAGGGFTGNGSRTGGIDGKGGFPAILHPRETVIDHTKGQRMGGNTTINVTVQGGSAPDVRRAAGQGAREALSVMGGAQRYS